jgi:hypothetical protein
MVMAVLAAAPASAAGTGSGTATVAKDALPDATYQLPFTGMSDIVTDANGHVFITGGAGTNGVVVRNADGSVNTTIAAEQGASGMVLSADGTQLYVGLYDAHAISVIDTTTLTETHRYALSLTDCPRSVAVVGSSLWFSTDCDSQWGTLGTLPLATGTVSHSGGNWYQAYLLAVPNDPSGLLVAQRGSNPAGVERDTVSGSTVTKVATLKTVPTDVCDNLGSMAIDPDGTHLVLACGAPYEHTRLKLSDLTPDGSYASTNYPDAVATSTAHGGLVAAGIDGAYAPDVFVYRGGAPVRAIELGGSSVTLADDGLAWSSDGGTLYAVAGVYGADEVLHVLVGAASADSTVTISGPSTVNRNQQLPLSGLLNSGGPLAGATVDVTRKDAAGTVDLGTVVTDGTGGWSLTDTEATAGAATYTVSYAGDADHAPATASTVVQVAGAAATVTVTTNAATYSYGSAVTVTVHLSTTYANPTVTLYAATYGTAYKIVGTVPVNSHGNAVFRAVVAGRTYFQAQFAGNAVYSPAKATRIVQVYGKMLEIFGGAYRSSGGVSFVHRTTNPTLVGQIFPHQGPCMRFQLQARVHGVWRAVATSDCFGTNSVGAAGAVLTGSHTVGVLERMRAVFPGSTLTLPTVGAWHYLEFTS